MSTSRNTLDLWRMDDDNTSRGTTVNHMFALCDVLALNGEHVPMVVGYRPSPVLHENSVRSMWPDCEYLDRLDDGTLSPDEARRALLLLNRYLNVCGLEGAA